MLRKPVPPKNCGGEGTQKSGLQAPAGSGSAWGAQVTPPSWLASTAPARDKQALVSQPSAGVANAIPVLSQALGSVPRPVPAWFSRGLAAASSQCRPPSLVRYSRTGLFPMAAPRSCTSQPCAGSLKSSQRATPGAWIGAGQVQERPPSAVPNTCVTAGRAPARVRVTASHARLGEAARRTA